MAHELKKSERRKKHEVTVASKDKTKITHNREIMLNIFSYLQPWDWAILSSVCLLWKEYLSENFLWKPAAERRWPAKKNEKNLPWQDFFRSCYKVEISGELKLSSPAPIKSRKASDSPKVVLTLPKFPVLHTGRSGGDQDMETETSGKYSNKNTEDGEAQIESYNGIPFVLCDEWTSSLFVKDLMDWFRNELKDYNVKIDNLHSFATGIPFLALLHKYNPTRINWDKFDKTDPEQLLNQCLQLSSIWMNIPNLLNPRTDIIHQEHPRSLLLYLDLYRTHIVQLYGEENSFNLDLYSFIKSDYLDDDSFTENEISDDITTDDDQDLLMDDYVVGTPEYDEDLEEFYFQLNEENDDKERKWGQLALREPLLLGPLAVSKLSLLESIKNTYDDTVTIIQAASHPNNQHTPSVITSGDISTIGGDGIPDGNSNFVTTSETMSTSNLDSFPAPSESMKDEKRESHTDIPPVGSTAQGLQSINSSQTFGLQAEKIFLERRQKIMNNMLLQAEKMISALHLKNSTLLRTNRELTTKLSVLEQILDKEEEARQNTELLINVEESIFQATGHCLEDKTISELSFNVKRRDNA